MIIVAELQKPCSDKDRADFIVQYNHNQGYEIRETEMSLEAWGNTEEEISQQKDEQETEQELLSLEDTLKELKNLYLQAQILGDNDTMTDVTAQIKELLGITDEQAETEELNGNNIEE